MKKIRSCIIFIIIAVFLGTSLFSSTFESVTTETADTLFAEEEFRRGVQAYNRGAFNDAVLLFENALSYLPTENLILDWLGRAYYRSGMEDAALKYWQYASDAGYGGLLLENRIEIVRERRLTDKQEISSTEYAEAGVFKGKIGEDYLFSQPASILPNPDGASWFLAYGTNELLLIDVNGLITKRIHGPLEGFNRPMDIVRRTDGTLFVSEFAADRISVLDAKGNYLGYIGGRGVKLGELVGPQYMALDSSENLYVTDFGNARVVVFDKDGNPLYDFGKKQGTFPGFKAPGGIAIFSDVVYVADAFTGAIYSFDRAGNYTGILVPEGSFERPEAIKVSGDYLIVSDQSRVCTVSLATGRIFENAKTGGAPSRLLCAVPDANGNLLVSNFKSNEIFVMSEMSELVGGLFVQIERVYADNFPEVVVELKVENRFRQPVVGLKEENFYLTENSRPVLDQRLLGAAASNEVADVTVVLDRSSETALYDEALESALLEIAQIMQGKGTLRVVSASNVPVMEYEGSPANLGDFTVEALKAPISDTCALDLALRLSANGLINGEKKRSVILLTGSTSVADNAFDTYGLSALSAYYNNNSISLYTVNLSQNALPAEISYLTDSTTGDSMYVYRPAGLDELMQEIIGTPNGMYQLSYTSSLPTDFGREYLPVEAEAYLLNRSGRDEVGYFAPLE